MPNTIQTADGAKESQFPKGQLVRAHPHNLHVRMCTHTTTQLGIVSMTGGPNWYTSERKRRGRDRRSARQANTAAPLCVFVFFCSTLTDSHRKAVSFNGHGVFTRPCRPGPGLMANGPAAGCPSRPPFFPSRRTHPWHYPVPHTPPHSPLDNCSDSNGLKMTLFSHFLFFFFLLVLLSLPPLLFSFHAG